jgi:two-component system chemotaxis response regulator CheB
MPERKIKVLVVDDSALARKLITESLVGHDDIEVIAGASDAYIARDKIFTLNPDVITLDIEMPRMDGLTFLKLIMRHRPMPVIVMSSLTVEGSSKVIEALECGAVEVLGKPNGPFSAFGNGLILAEKIRAAAQARIARPATASQPVTKATDNAVASAAVGSITNSNSPSAAPARPTPARAINPRSLIVMGASTGGTEALKECLTVLPKDLPPICVVQHIPAQFSAAFAARLNALCQIEVREAKSGDELRPGLALIAPGGRHLIVRWSNNRYVAMLNDGPPIHHQRPAVDVLFDSLVKSGNADQSIGVLMTGMGKDGAAGLLNLRQNGAATIAQSEATCVVFGMPAEAIRLGAAKSILDLNDIPAEIERQSRRFAARTTEALAQQSR